MRNRRQNFVFDPVSVGQHPFLLAARAKLASLAGKGQQVIVAAAVTVDAREAFVEIPAVNETLEDIVHHRALDPPSRAQLGHMVDHALVQRTGARIARTIDRATLALGSIHAGSLPLRPGSV